MKIIIEENEPTEISEFADHHGLTMRVTGRQHVSKGEPNKYYARFEGVETKDGVVLRGVYGNGATPDEAIDNYAGEISGERLVYLSGSPGRREFYAPQLVYRPAQIA